MIAFLLLAWRVLVTNAEQCREPLWAKLELIADEFHPARSFAAFRRPLKEVAPGGRAETETLQPAGLTQLLKEGFHVGSHLVFIRLCHEIEARDNWRGGEA